jgi:hypothetical protein
MNLSTWIRDRATSKVGALVAVGVIAAVAGTGASVAAGHITSAQIKDGTIQTRDLTKNNFARFTATENVVSATTPVSTVPAYGGARVVPVNAANTPLATLVLDKGTWKITGTAQFFHIGPPVPADPDYGVVTVPGLQEGFARNWTGDVPDGGSNAAQVSFNGTIRILANDTPVVITGEFTGANTGQAGVSVQATQYQYVKLFNGGS